MAEDQCRILWRHVSNNSPDVLFLLLELIHRLLYSHVNKTGDIKDFVIIEESGIAKGIRRVIAVTGHEANDVKRQAAALTSRAEQIDRMAGKAKDAALKTLAVVSGLMKDNSINSDIDHDDSRNLVRPISPSWRRTIFENDWLSCASPLTSKSKSMSRWRRKWQVPLKGLRLSFLSDTSI